MLWLVLACSGPGAMKVIENNERIGWLVFLAGVGVAAVTTAVLVVKRWPTRWMYVMVVSALINPGLWMSARMGDCGRMVYFGAFIGLSLTCLLALVTVIAGIRKARVDAV